MLVLVTSPCWAALFFWKAFPRWVAEFRSETFVAEEWQRCDPEKSDLRFRMLPSLLRKHRMVGMPPAEVKTLLGRPFHIENEARTQRQSYHYLLGTKSPSYNAWSYPWLVVELIDGRVKRVYQLEGLGASSSTEVRQE
ncbi:MAG: hypothetical protein K8T89_02545 [Planctomycetes bacterium]|nr:hypothetical protein [Planctomycetota bacterium]